MFDRVQICGDSWPRIEDVNVIGGKKLLSHSGSVRGSIVLLKDDGIVVLQKWENVGLEDIGDVCCTRSTGTYTRAVL